MEPNDIQRDMIDVELHALGTENARLRRVNAALLEALERTLPMLTRLGDFIGNGAIDATRPDSLGMRCDLILDIRAAIAQAKGETNA